ncbi:hypothetical protein OAM98_02565 [Schleiferiaceae bacterium]|nr:hypothetical protein [Schleiferiaceae bacterium]
MEDEKPKPYQEYTLGGMKFDKRVLEKYIEAAKESGIENDDLLKQTAFQMYYAELQLKSTNRIRNNVVFWFWITAGWIILAVLGGLGIGIISRLF